MEKARSNSRGRTVGIAMALALALGLVPAAPAFAYSGSADEETVAEIAAAEGSWTRIAGNTRYETMAKAVQEAFDDGTADCVVVASGESYADSLAATSLAGALDAPVILVSTMDITDSAASEIARVGAESAYIIGGTSSVSFTVAAQIGDIVGVDNVVRIAGSDRYATALAVAENTLSILNASGESADTVVVATGTGYADALSVSPYTYSTSSPILLAGSDGVLDDGSASWISSSGIDSMVIVGGSRSVSDDVASQAGIEDCTRLSGSDRYGTSSAIANWAIANGYLGVDGAAVASGTGFADALAASALCGQNGSVLLLASDSSTVTADDVIRPNAGSMTYGYFVGGQNSLSAAVVAAFENASGMLLN